MREGRSTGPVVAKQVWRHVLSLHWRFPPATLRRLVPAGLDLDLMGGHGWAGVVLRVVEQRSVAGVQRAFGLDASTAEVRAYVRAGTRRGVWPLSVDTDGRLAGRVGRFATGLPYRRASLQLHARGRVFDQEVARTGQEDARLRLRWEIGDPLSAVPGTLAHFLLDRDACFTRRLGRLWRTEARHAPPAPRDAFVLLREDGLLAAAGLPRPAEPPYAIYDEGTEVEWLAPALVGRSGGVSRALP